MACPFGKTNSSLEFCPVVALFAKSLAVRYEEKFSQGRPTLGTHVDDVFGGFKSDHSYDRARHFREFIFTMGATHTVNFNPKPSKTPLPAKRQVILGRQYDSATERVTTAEKKITKYRLRIAAALAVEINSTKELEKLHGCLNYVAALEPFGRPFLAHLTMAISTAQEDETVSLSPLSRLGLRIWDLLLMRNKGTSMDFILGRLPYATADVFVDASSMWGIGGVYGEYFFKIPWEKLVQADQDIIARKELLACLVAVLCFGDLIEGKFVQLWTDNENAFN